MQEKDKKRYIEYEVILEDLISRNHVTVVNCRDLFHAISARDAIATDLLAGNFWYFIEFSDYRANDILVNKVDKND